MIYTQFALQLLRIQFVTCNRAGGSVGVRSGCCTHQIRSDSAQISARVAQFMAPVRYPGSHLTGEGNEHPLERPPRLQTVGVVKKGMSVDLMCGTGIEM
jgi:hypothetical protein